MRRDGLVGFVERTFDPTNPDAYSDRRYEFMIDGATAPAGLGDCTKGQHRQLHAQTECSGRTASASRAEPP